MKGFRFLPLFLALVLFQACSGPHQLVTTWKTDRFTTGHYNKILVVAILPDKDSVLRREMEAAFTGELEQSGYPAQSAFLIYGAKGLSNSGQEDTYLKLYGRGFDAVFTIALVRKTEQNFHRPGKAYTHPNSYYYNRIWNYKNIQEADTLPAEDTKPEYFWETILFDLSTLEAACTIRTAPFTKDEQAGETADLSRKIIRKMLREKVLRKQKAAPRAF